MKKNNRKSLVILAIGALLLSATFVLRHYFAINDFSDGILKGIGIGLMIYSLILPRNQRCKTSQS
ncbi:hypothetical protein [Flavobacterium aestivum]|uniref:hypothetical protein n=1 Tax=Flavobacterium aestivum TaxID=3003257 RepID=UPI0024825B58|nr:hypothetical protein [Flavobacterium aestivum]